jgi:Putative peptidoglycan binding domain
MSSQDDSARDPVRPYAEPWAAELPFVGEAAEERVAAVHQWYQAYGPFVESQVLEEVYDPEAEEEDYSAELEEESDGAVYEPIDDASELYPEHYSAEPQDKETDEQTYEPLDEASELELYQEPLAKEDEYPVAQPTGTEHLMQEHFESFVEEVETLLDNMVSDSRYYDFAAMSEAEIEALLSQYQPVGNRLPQGFEYFDVWDTAKDTAKRVFRDAVSSIKKAAAYGGYTLQRGDRDDRLTYGGAVRSAAAGDNVPAAGTTPFVRQLQRDLAALGFRIVGTANGDFARRTEWAVREFQIYAKMSSVAAETGAGTRYVDRLVQTPNTRQYTGNVSGVVNAETRSLLQHWIANRWRCPVIVEARNMVGGAPGAVHTENIWMWNEVTSTRPRMFARDFSGYYTFPGGRNANDLIPLGDYATLGRWSGPRSVPPRHTWSPEGELLPEHLVGTDLARLNAPQRSTYKVVRAVSEVECIGFFDSVNSYDNAFVSLGPCHWTLGIADSRGNVSEGELCGYLAYLRNVEPAAFRRAIEFFGVRVDEDWFDGATGMANGRNLFQSGQRKYAGWIALQKDDRTFARMPTRAADDAEDEGNYFKTWHWFYRFVMAGRTIEGFRRRTWHMARVRVRDILATQWPAGVVPDVPVAGGGTRRPTIGDVYTSERAVALLLRWHIRYPGNVISGGRAGNRLENAFRNAAIPAGAGDPTTWNDRHEAYLIDGIMREVRAIANAGFTRTMTYVNNWPASWGANPRGYILAPTIGALANTRNSFQFDATDLPPPP